MSKSVPRWQMLTALLGMVLAVLLFVDAHPYLRGGFGWRWPHVPASALKTGVLVLAVGVYVGGAWMMRARRGAVLLAFIGALVLGVLGAWVRSDAPIGYTLFTRTVSKMTTGPHHAAATLILNRETLTNWAEIMASYDPNDDEAATVSRHVMLAPPAIPMLFAGTANLLASVPRLSEWLQVRLICYQCQNYAILEYPPAVTASAWLGMLLPLWGALTVFPLYRTGERLGLNGRDVALWWPLVPMLASFAGSWNTVYPLFAVIAFDLLLRGGLWVIAAGLVTGWLTFMNFAPVPFGLLVGLFVLLRWLFIERDTVSFRRPLVMGLQFGVGVFGFWGLWMLWGGDSPFAMLDASFGAHLDLDRPYWPWVFLHTYDWVLFAGAPLAIASVGMMRQRMTGAGVLAWALWLSVVILALSGTARGETARVWSFFTPFVLLAAAGLRLSGRGWLWLTASQAALLIALVATWGVFDAGDMPPMPDAPYPLIDGGQTVNATLDDAGLTLVTWQTDGAWLDLTWHMDDRTATPYWFAALLIDPNGQPVGETVIWQGGDTRYPTTCWPADGLVRDRVKLPLTDDSPTGDYWLSVSVFADEDNPAQRETVTLADGSTDTQIGLGPVRWD